MLKGKTILLGVTGSIAAYKAAGLASLLKKQHATVHVIMTKNACQFINPITFESLCGTKCLVDTFDRNFEFQVEHVALAKQADLVMVAPASADCIGKMACGIADDMLTTTILACKCPKLIAPAMNTRMYENPLVQDNLKKLKYYGFTIAEPAVGYLACGDTGAGKMLEPQVLLSYILREAAFEKDLKGKKVLVTAGATREAIDPVRFITNHSTGKMGYAIAKMAMLRGAEVTVISGHTEAELPMFVRNIPVSSAADMFQTVCEELHLSDGGQEGVSQQPDIIIKCAAVADYTPKETAAEKIKKKMDTELSLELARTNDILKYIGEHKSKKQFVCGFSMETENLLENSRAKLEKKNVDMIAANNLKTEGAGFGTDTNVLTLITRDRIRELPIMSKEKAAGYLLDYIIELME